MGPPEGGSEDGGGGGRGEERNHGRREGGRCQKEPLGSRGSIQVYLRVPRPLEGKWVIRFLDEPSIFSFFTTVKSETGSS